MLKTITLQIEEALGENLVVNLDKDRIKMLVMAGCTIPDAIEREIEIFARLTKQGFYSSRGV